VAAFVRRNIYIITAAKGLFMANRLMPYALNLTPAPFTPSGRTRATDLPMCRATEISPVRESPKVRVITVARRHGNLAEPGILSVILCSATGELSHALAGASKLCAVTFRARPVSFSALQAALSIRRVIRGNFTRCVGILAGKRSAVAPAADDPVVRKSNEPMPLIDVTTYVPARLADDDRKRKGDGSPGTAVITKTRPQTKRPNLYRVLLLNDDYTPMEFVVHVLERFFNKDHETAHRIMMHVHQHGIGECGVFTYEVAETKVTQVMDFARKHQHPLQCIMEKK
jgi:ATP-dependent Clp protease adaptor protein ClpS